MSTPLTISPPPPVRELPYLDTTVRLVPQAGRTRAHRRGSQLLVPATDARPAIERFYRRAARVEIAARLDRATALAGVRYRDLSIRGQRTRWASCSSNGHMSFNWRLLLAPEPVLEYVVWHEVCHLEILDHSRRFWALVARRWPRYREDRDWLRRHGATLVLSSSLRPSIRLSILWRVFSINAVVFGVAVLVLIASPATVSNPIKRSELIALIAGLVVTLAVDLVLLMLVMSPLRRLATLMGDIDPMRPGQRAPVREWMSTEIVTLSRAFNTMLDRLEAERRESAHRALAAQESERLRVARELHDEIGQSLTAVALRAERAADELPMQTPALREIVDTVHHSLDDVRRIARELRPEALDDLGLVDALISLCLRMERQGAVRVARELEGGLPPLSPEVELVIYRVAQEALTNAFRHAQATQVRVSLKRAQAEGDILLSVADDGRGLPEPLPTRAGGLAGMRERAILIGAELDIDSTAGRGVEVRLRVAANDDADADPAERVRPMKTGSNR